MITLCWAAKGGSGTTVVAASIALANARDTLLVDLDRDQPAVLGLAEPDSPGVHDWLTSTAPVSRLGALEIAVRPRLTLLPGGPWGIASSQRWEQLAAVFATDHRDVIVDVGTRTPPHALVAVADRTWLVTRPCYLALRAAARSSVRSTGVVLIDEPGRAMRSADVEAAIGVPVAAVLLYDPAVSRAVDSGLLVSRLPAGMTRTLRQAA
jgi:MinD-like ATPase involved in chromosome partitioning or flagellar assembly